MILVIDNYDSFTFNLVQALAAAGAHVEVVRNDRIDRDEIDRLAAGGGSDAEGGPLRGIVISPGPGNPASAGVSVAAVAAAADHRVPLLGVCLGHQCLAAAFGASIVRAPSLVHGEASDVQHDGHGLLQGLPSPFPAARYHSLCVDAATLPAELTVSARTEDGVVMGLRHRSLPLEGVQFHPESVLTPEGPRLLANFLRLAGEGSAVRLESDEGAGFARHGLPGPGGGDVVPDASRGAPGNESGAFGTSHEPSDSGAAIRTPRAAIERAATGPAHEGSSPGRATTLARSGREAER